MKTLGLIILFLAAGLYSVPAAAQGIEITQVQEKMSRGKQYGLRVFIPGASDRDVSKQWKKWIKDHGGKPDNVKKELFGDDLILPSLSANTVDVYAQIEDGKDGVEMTVYFDLGGAYLNRAYHPDAWEAANNMLRDFAVQQARAVINVQLETMQKEFQRLSNELDKFEKEQKSLENNIKKWKESIEQAEKDLKENNEQQKKKKKELSEREKEINALKENLNEYK